MNRTQEKRLTEKSLQPLKPTQKMIFQSVTSLVKPAAHQASTPMTRQINFMTRITFDRNKLVSSIQNTVTSITIITFDNEKIYSIEAENDYFRDKDYFGFKQHAYFRDTMSATQQQNYDTYAETKDWTTERSASYNKKIYANFYKKGINHNSSSCTSFKHLC